jgi:hypothetical protein
MALTICFPLSARDAVATLTPARFATSRIVTVFFATFTTGWNRLHETGYSRR